MVPPRYMPPQFRDLAALSAWMCYSLFLNRLDLRRLATDFKAILLDGFCGLSVDSGNFHVRGHACCNKVDDGASDINAGGFLNAFEARRRIDFYNKRPRFERTISTPATCNPMMRAARTAI